MFQLKISQDELACRIGWDRSFLSRVESGKQNITIENLNTICTGLNMSLKDFFRRLTISYQMRTSIMKTTYKLIDLFAGIGGIRLGFEQAFQKDISTVFVSEWDKYAQLTYEENFKDNFPIAGDITKIQENEIPDFDICLAGFPCQAFSMAGKRMGFKDDFKGMCRGTLFLDVARICEYHKPKVIFVKM